MATDQEILAAEARLKKFMADLTCLCERHNLIIDKDIKPAYLRVYDKNNHKKIGKIKYNWQKNKYQEYLSPTDRHIREEVKAEIKEEHLQKILDKVNVLQNQFLKEVVQRNPGIVSEEEELIYQVALDKIEDKFDDCILWNDIRYEPKKYTWRKIENLHWKVVDKGEVILEITKEDVFHYMDEDFLEDNYSEYL